MLLPRPELQSTSVRSFIHSLVDTALLIGHSEAHHLFPSLIPTCWSLEAHTGYQTLPKESLLDRVCPWLQLHAPQCLIQVQGLAFLPRWAV